MNMALSVSRTMSTMVMTKRTAFFMADLMARREKDSAEWRPVASDQRPGISKSRVGCGTVGRQGGTEAWRQGRISGRVSERESSRGTRLFLTGVCKYRPLYSGCFLQE